MENRSLLPMISRKHKIDLATYPRRGLFNAFKDRDMPCFSLTCNLDIAPLLARLRGSGHRFSITMSYLLTVAVNRVPELRHRLIDGEPWEFERVDPGWTVLLADKTFSFCDGVFDADFDTFHADAERRTAAVRERPDHATGDKHHMFFITSIPWLSFTAINHPYDAQYASIPLLTLGKYFRQGEQVLLPLAIQVHHALVDGWHVARFYDEMQQLVADAAIPSAADRGRPCRDGG
ncbi:chloramphenicol acetyltransferase [Thiohalocapsa sp. ML1]|uniref:chloramphenicol acetyltransferase n=1 Tax=Thiohalocapsa sp. ML1 TaxID=1431688 RepID=UPI00073243F5|nr:chloramphenicol acetyltransferase [Thiohalocapsa sp. ML1]